MLSESTLLLNPWQRKEWFWPLAPFRLLNTILVSYFRPLDDRNDSPFLTVSMRALKTSANAVLGNTGPIRIAPRKRHLEASIGTMIPPMECPAATAFSEGMFNPFSNSSTSLAIVSNVGASTPGDNSD
jgi:hypothetical protein